MFFLPLLILINISNVQSLIPIKKCCPQKYVLNLNFYECENFEADNKLTDKLANIGFSLKNNGLPQCADGDTFLYKNLSFFSKKTRNYFSDICVDSTIEDSQVLLACTSAPMLSSVSKRLGIKKCCPMFHMLMQNPMGSCGPTNQTFNLKALSKYAEIYPSELDITSPGCTDKDMLSDEEYGQIWILNSGTLSVAVNTTHRQNYSKHEFCVDLVEGFDSVVSFYCTGNANEASVHLEFKLIAVGLIISVVFLIITFIIYTCEIKKQNLYGRTLMCHIGSLIVAYMCLVSQQLQTVFYQLPLFLCDHLRFIMFFSFLSAFLWLNVMSIDIWRTFRCIRSRNVASSRKILRFMLYSIYSWGVPAVLTTFAKITTQYDILPPSIALTIDGCWFSKMSNGYYLVFILPIASTLCCNTILYIITAWRCYQVKKDINVMHRSDKKQTNTYFRKKEQLKLNIKLFLVMGITWSMEVISVLVKSKYDDPSYARIWYLSDALNALYGLIIFAIFAMKKKNLQIISRRFSKFTLRRRSENLNLRKTSSTINPSTVSTSLGDTLAACDPDN